jgi:hypothetical protein
MNETPNQPQKTTHVVEIVGLEKECRVKQPKIEVRRNETVVFKSKDAEAKISFPDSGIINNKDCWETIESNGSIVREVITSDTGTYYYAVMCKHDDGTYWYAEGNTCPAMIVK